MEDVHVDIKEFLNFLSMVCKINFLHNSEDFKNIDLDLNELASDPLVVRLIEQLCTTKKLDAAQKTENRSPNLVMESIFFETEYLSEMTEIVNKKLAELLNEGIFDSILSYLMPNKLNPSNVKSITRCESKSPTRNKAKKKEKRKKGHDSKMAAKHDTEVEIHVYDEIRGSKRDFKCKQSLLTSNMGYFSEITKGQKLEEMDISVHCEITIFEWLIKWMKAGSPSSTTVSPPKLDYDNVVPIMVSADFLQMKPLFQDCINYCRTNLNEIVKYTSNLPCLSDRILTKLANKLSNTEVQYLKDKKDRIKSRLFCKLIMSLNEEEPERHRGHFGSLAYLQICLNCGKLITKLSAPYIPCQLQYITIKLNGDVIFNHSRDPKWNINEHIKNIFSEYKVWSSTYWRLWSQCHFLYCYMCCTMYAVAFSDCCPYHPQQPHFYPMEQFQTTNSPIGRYPCCGSKAIRFETIMIRTGCKLRSHIPKLQTSDDASIQTIIDSFPDLIKVKYSDDKVAMFTDNYDLANFEGIYKNTFMNTREISNTGLIRGPLFESCLRRIQKYKCAGSWEPSTEIGSFKREEIYENFDYYGIGESENSDTSLIQEFSTLNVKPSPVTCDEIQSKLSRNEVKPRWSPKYSIRHNQDNQRDFEEVAFQAMSEVLLQRIESQKAEIKKLSEANNASGGVYPEIESEWKEMQRFKSSGNKNKTLPS